MARRPRRAPPPSLAQRLIALVRRHPLKTVAACVVFLGGIPTAAGGYSMLMAWADPAIPVWRAYMREQLEPIIKIQNTQAVGIDRFILYQQQNALAAAKSDSASKTSPIVQERIRELESQAKDTQARICKATGKNC